MPSSVKKRKATRLNKEMRPHHPADSPANTAHVHGNGPSGEEGLIQHEAKEGDCSSDQPVTDEEAEENKKQQPEEYTTATSTRSEDSAVKGAMESSEASEVEASKGPSAPLTPEVLTEETVVVKEEMLHVEQQLARAEDVGIEYVEAKKDEESSGVGGEPPLIVGPTDVTVAQSVPMTVAMQAAEVQAVGTEALVPIDTPSQEGEVKVVPQQEASSEQSREVTITTGAAPGPILQHRATWWNCCGLLDALASSQRSCQ